jgi:hypothetical protein
MARHPGRYHKNISLFIKLAIVGLAFGFIYKQVFYRPDSEDLLGKLRQVLSDPPYLFLFIGLALMFLNWGLEAWKWRMLVSKSEQISFGHALKAVLSGVTIGAFTPNRFGEFAGRIFYLRNTDRIDGILMTFAGSAAQLLITVLMGCIALNVYAFMDASGPSRENMVVIAIALIVAALTFLLVVIYFNIASLSAKLSGVRFLRKYKQHVLLLAGFSKAELLNVFLLSLGRYAVFSFQYYLLLKVFDVDIGMAEGLIGISISFFIVAMVPTFALAELGIRGSAALACLGNYSDNHLGIIAASFLLWIINIALPAIAGAVFVFGLKFYKEKS